MRVREHSIPALGQDLPTIPPLPFRRGEGWGEGSNYVLGFRGKNRFSLSGRAANARGGSSPGLNLTVCLEASWMISGVGCAASRLSAGESASRSVAAKRRNGGGSPGRFLTVSHYLSPLTHAARLCTCCGVRYPSAVWGRRVLYK